MLWKIKEEAGSGPVTGGGEARLQSTVWALFSLIKFHYYKILLTEAL